MKKSVSLKAGALLCAVALIAAAGLSGLFGFAGLPKAYAEKYNSGDTEICETVKNLEIEWTSGRVNIVYHRGNTVLITEKSSAALRPDERLQWRMDGETLQIRYEKPGLHLFSFHEKELTVTLPEGIGLQEARVSAASAALSIPDLRAEKLVLEAASGVIDAQAAVRKVSCETTSGNIELRIMEKAEEISVSSTSGNVILETAGAEKIRIGTTSGAIRAAVNAAGEFKADSASGDIQAVLGEVKKTKIGCTSGAVDVRLSVFDTLEVDTVSGGVRASLPETPGFTARFDTVSGQIEHKIPLSRQGRAYVCGNGKGEVKIDTVSGNITIAAFSD